MKGYKKTFFGGVFGVFFSVFLLFLVNSSFFTSSRKLNNKKVSKFEIKKIKKKQEIVSQKKKPKKMEKENLKPDLKSMISGMSFGIPAFELDLGSGSDFLKNGNYVNGNDVDQKPKVLYRPELDFPEKALSNNISGFVTFGLFIDENGKLQKIDIIESSPKGVFEDTALSNIKKWRFKAAVHKGIKVSTWQEQKIVFDGGQS